MSGHVRYRVCGGTIVAPVEDSAAGKPFRKADLHPKEELYEKRAELARLEKRLAGLRYTSEASGREFPDLVPGRFASEEAEIAKLRAEVRSLDLIWNDSAPKPEPVTLAEINRRNREHYGR
jgi:hypothetical protein